MPPSLCIGCHPFPAPPHSPELDKEADGPALRAELGAKVDRTSVPAIWIDKVFIGGCNDGPLGGINTVEAEGKLDGMLSAAGAI